VNIKRFGIVNFKGVEAIDVAAAGRNVYVMGNNAVGKTSVLDAIWALLTGNDVPNEPISKGKNAAKITAEFDGWTAQMDFKRKTAKDKIKRELTVFNKDGVKVDSPRALIDSLAGKSVAFSIDKFFALSDKVRAEYLADAIGLGNDYRNLHSQYNDAFDFRRVKNAELKRYDAQIEPFNVADCNLPVADVSTLANQLAVAVSSANTYAQAQATRNALVAEKDKIVAEVERLQSEVLRLNGQLHTNSQRLNAADAWFQTPANQPVNAETITALEASINDIDAIRSRRDHAVMQQTIQAEAEVSRDEIVKVETEMKEMQSAIGHLLSERLAIPDMTFDVETNRLFLNGLPFESNQINRAEQVRIGLKIAAKILKPDGIRVVRFDGSIMDYSNLEQVQIWASEANVQLFVELVERDAEGLTIQIGETKPSQPEEG